MGRDRAENEGREVKVSVGSQRGRVPLGRFFLQGKGSKMVRHGRGTFVL